MIIIYRWACISTCNASTLVMKHGLHYILGFLYPTSTRISPNAFETKQSLQDRFKLVKFLKHLENGKILCWEWRHRWHSDKRLHDYVVVGAGESVMPFTHCSYRWRLCWCSCHRCSFLQYHFWLFRSLPRALCCNPFFLVYISILQKKIKNFFFYFFW